VIRIMERARQHAIEVLANEAAERIIPDLRRWVTRNSVWPDMSDVVTCLKAINSEPIVFDVAVEIIMKKIDLERLHMSLDQVLKASPPSSPIKASAAQSSPPSTPIKASAAQSSASSTPVRASSQSPSKASTKPPLSAEQLVGYHLDLANDRLAVTGSKLRDSVEIRERLKRDYLPSFLKDDQACGFHSGGFPFGDQKRIWSPWVFPLSFAFELSSILEVPLPDHLQKVIQHHLQTLVISSDEETVSSPLNFAKAFSSSATGNAEATEQILVSSPLTFAPAGSAKAASSSSNYRAAEAPDQQIPTIRPKPAAKRGLSISSTDGAADASHIVELIGKPSTTVGVTGAATAEAPHESPPPQKKATKRAKH